MLQHRDQIKKLAALHGAANVRVFGSVARGSETPPSDVDLLVDLAPNTGVLGLALWSGSCPGCWGAKVDVISAGGLKRDVASDALADVFAL